MLVKDFCNAVAGNTDIVIATQNNDGTHTYITNLWTSAARIFTIDAAVYYFGDYELIDVVSYSDDAILFIVGDEVC